MYAATACALGYREPGESQPGDCSDTTTITSSARKEEARLHFCDVCHEWVGDVSEHYQSVAHQFQRGCPPMRTTTLPVTNKGYQMLTHSMGWDDYDGRGLGKRNQGGTCPVKTTLRRGRAGIGRAAGVPRGAAKVGAAKVGAGAGICSRGVSCRRGACAALR